MTDPRKHQVSLRGASAREISRDDLLEKVSQERELRNYTRRATASALCIQKVWRRHNAIKLVSLQLQQEWETTVQKYVGPRNRMLISTTVLRPFLLFTKYLLPRCQKEQSRNFKCMRNCFKIVLESINSTDPRQNFCSMATGTEEEKEIWLYQSKKLISLSLYVLAQYHNFPKGVQDLVLTILAMRLIVTLTDLKSWKSISDKEFSEADKSVKDLIHFMGSKNSGLYNCIRQYISKLEPSLSSSSGPTDDTFLVTASAITSALRPFHCATLNVNDAIEQYCTVLLTIPRFCQRLPAALLPALRHNSVLSPCLRVILISKDKILKDISSMDELNVNMNMSSNKTMPQLSWLLTNIINLATEDSGKFTNSLDYASYVHVCTTLSETLLDWLEKNGWTRKENEEEMTELPMHEADTSLASYTDHFKPVYQQWHLMKLLSFITDSSETQTKFELIDIAYFYSCMLRIFSILNPVIGSLPVLNMLAFTPGFLQSLWEALEKILFPEKTHFSENNTLTETRLSEDNKYEGVSDRKSKMSFKEGGNNRWFNVLHKITKKPQTQYIDSTNAQSSSKQIIKFVPDTWDVKPLIRGPEGILNDTSCLLYLFCSTYSHLLLVLDDIEFYEKQAPFKLDQQRRIASTLNSLVYNAFKRGFGPSYRLLVDSAIRCLHMLYERDCRHKFCPPELWLSPGKYNRPPIAKAARTHEMMTSSTSRVDDSSSSSPNLGSVISVIPHIFPFEERVKMFREFINMDKVSRKMAGEVLGPGLGSIKLVLRRDHIVEDGFEQLNSLGSRLKSNINVSFVSESGIIEAGLDFGGLSKEFLTDIAKAAFSPDYGLFLQTSTSDRLLIPNTSARFLENGIQMIEFLGKIVGKALYEGILLEYSFSHVFVQKLLGRYSFVDELSSLDPELYKNLMYVKHYDGDVQELCLDFTVTEEFLGRRHVTELKPGGKDISVTNENKLQYIYAIADYKLNRQILLYSNAFYRGLTDLISPNWLKLFNASEFNQLLSGGKYDIDVDDLRKNTRYTGGYTEGSRTIKLFWEVYAELEPKERCMVVKFVTSCSRGPLLGFKHLQPTFTIHKVAGDIPLWATLGGQDVDRLPSASTCYNTLKLPTYKRATTLKAKLLYAINSNAGFELS